MSFVSASPEFVAAAATDLAAIGSTISSANSAALGPTSAVLAPGADEVSVSIASLFDAHSQVYQAMSVQASAFHSQFVQLMNGGASQYSLTEAANASPLQTAAGPASAAAQVPAVSAGPGGSAPAAPAAAPLGAAVAPAAVAASPAQAATPVAAAPAGSATLASATAPGAGSSTGLCAGQFVGQRPADGVGAGAGRHARHPRAGRDGASLSGPDDAGITAYGRSTPARNANASLLELGDHGVFVTPGAGASRGVHVRPRKGP